ncbi:MAG: hypothetical protein P9L88_07610 [Candidatus Tantalella remota]|nr:hypothetical protein [Candidatus Tantalella remota]
MWKLYDLSSQLNVSEKVDAGLNTSPNEEKGEGSWTGTSAGRLFR